MQPSEAAVAGAHAPFPAVLGVTAATVALCSCFDVSSVQSLSRVRLFVTPWTAARQASLSITSSRSSLTLMSIESVTPSNHHLLSPSSLLALNLSQRQAFPMNWFFSNEWASFGAQMVKNLPAF